MADIANSKLLNTGIPEATDACVVLVKTEWNSAITDELERGCLDVLRKQNVKKIITVTVPGCFEIPFAINLFPALVLFFIIALLTVVIGLVNSRDVIADTRNNGYGFTWTNTSRRRNRRTDRAGRTNTSGRRNTGAY